MVFVTKYNTTVVPQPEYNILSDIPHLKQVTESTLTRP